MTALGCYLLETGKVDAVLHVRASDTRPMETDAIVSRTPEEVRSGAQSRYGPAAPLAPVMELLDEGITFALLAKPCDVAAIRNLAAIDPRAEKQIPYLTTLFCGGAPSLHTASDIAAHYGLAPDQVAVFRFRGEGWPGPTHIESQDGRVFDLTYDQAWFSRGVPWKYDMQFRCKICPDAIGELADIVCPDAWIMRDGKPIHEEAPGANLLIARTERGEALVAEAAAASPSTNSRPCTPTTCRANWSTRPGSGRWRARASQRPASPTSARRRCAPWRERNASKPPRPAPAGVSGTAATGSR
jgi:coenzyme F420 hydrogenase subunit beta